MGALKEPGSVARAQTREGIVEAAARLLRTGGAAAVTTRAVAAEASVQAPTIYRLFGDKDGLLEAVATQVFTGYLQGKARREPTDDPVADLADGWETHIGFGLANPALFVLLADPQRGPRLLAGVRGVDILRDRVHRVAVAGRLRVSETRAVDMIRSAGTGVVLTMLGAAPNESDPGLPGVVYDAVKRTIITDLNAIPGGSSTAAAAVALRANLPQIPALTGAERALIAEWLDRIVAS